MQSANCSYPNSSNTSTCQPISPILGDIWYDPTTQYCKMYNGTDWIIVQSAPTQEYIKRIRVNKYYDIIIRGKNKEFVYSLEKLPEYSTFSANLDSILYETSFKEVIITLREFGVPEKEIDYLKLEVEQIIIELS